MHIQRFFMAAIPGVINQVLPPAIRRRHDRVCPAAPHVPESRSARARGRLPLVRTQGMIGDNVITP
jgi:hypothetical protein